MIPWPVRSFFLTILLTLISFSTGRDTLTPTQPLADNETLLSSSGNFALGFFTPINSKSNNRYLGLWYKKIADQTIVWVANRNSPVVGSKGTLWITANGILTITNQNSTIFWSTNITGITDAVAQLLDTGNLVVKQSSDSGDRYAWQSFDYPTDTMIPGMKLGVDHTTGLIRNLTSWTSYNDPSPGAYNLVMDINGVPEMSLCHGSTKVWRSGPLIGLQFRTGIQFSEMQDVISKYGLTFSFVDNDEEQALFYNISNLSIFSRLVVNFTGYVQQSLWLEGSGQWLFPWTTPKGQCDQIGACGPYGVCDPAASPICCCLQGFMPNNQPGWFLRDGSEGCIRKVTLDCWNGTDGFATVSRVKLPDTSNHTVYMSLSLNECRAMCLNNCSCTAYASANVSGGRLGCLIWATELYDIKLYDEAGQDLYVRLAAADLVSTPGNSPDLTPGEISHKGRSALVAIIVSLLVGVLLLACAGCFLWKRRKMRRHKVTGARNHAKDRPTDEVNGNDIELPLFDFAIIEVATDNFSDGGKLGEGGFGPVYKGKLGNDQEIAVKRLSKTSQQGVDEFKNEVVLIAKLQHRNLVRLLGCCIQREERMLIYEYLPNKSLDSFLFGKAKFALDWKTRYQIIIGITRGLLYLHHDSRFRVIHRDLKASNILLDKEMNPKISDFGMARIFGGDETDFNTRKVVGTYGYMSPEYAMEGTFSMKSDVFSFGVLVLEIISGKKNRGEYSFSPHLNLVAHAWSLWNEEKSLQLVDESIIQSFPMNEVLKCIKISLLCVQEHPEDRPLMSSVIQMLGSDIASLPQPKQPGFIARIFPVQTNSSPSKQGLCTVNDITVSILEGR